MVLEIPLLNVILRIQGLDLVVQAASFSCVFLFASPWFQIFKSVYCNTGVLWT